MIISLIIPAHNEAQRIARTLAAYADYFNAQPNMDLTLIVVLNACQDDTESVVRAAQTQYSNIRYHVLEKPGKGHAVRYGFKDALAHSAEAHPADQLKTHTTDQADDQAEAHTAAPQTEVHPADQAKTHAPDQTELIGFVDADMATKPADYHALITALGNADGVIASRYMPGAVLDKPRPWLKRLGSYLAYEALVKLLLNVHCHDYQCGAKLFKREALAAVIDQLSVDQWAFDVELLYLLNRHGFTIKEHPTVWADQAGSTLSTGSAGLHMLMDVIKIRCKQYPTVPKTHKVD